jgi:hypothetical protein
MENDQDEAATERREECCGTVDGTGEHRRKDEPQDGIECRLLRKKSAVSASHDHQRSHEDNHAPKTDLYERETGGVTAQAEEHLEISDDCGHVVLLAGFCAAFALTRRSTLVRAGSLDVPSSARHPRDRSERSRQNGLSV